MRLGLEVGKGELDDVEGSDEVGFKLVSEFVVILVFPCAYYSCRWIISQFNVSFSLGTMFTYHSLYNFASISTGEYEDAMVYWGLLCDYINSPPMTDSLLNDSIHGLSYSNAAKQTKTACMPVFHFLHGPLEGPAHSGDFIAMRQSCADQ